MSQKKNKLLRYFFYAVLAVIVLGLSVVFFWDKLPYRSAAARQIEAFLEAQGITVNSLEVDNISNNSASISDIDLGEDKHLLLKNLTAKYQLESLYKNKKIDELELQGLQLNAYQKDGSFTLGGVESSLKSEGESSSKLDFDALIASVPKNVVIQDSTLDVKLDKNNISVPFAFNFSKQEVPEIQLSSEQINAGFSESNISVKGLKLDAKYDATKKNISGKIISDNIEITSEGVNIPSMKLSADYVINEDKKINMKGKLSAEKIQITSEEFDIPELKLSMDFSLNNEKLTADFNMHSKDNKWKLLANVDVPIANPSAALAQVKQLKFPYANGEVSAKVAKLPINLSKVIVAEVKLKNVDLNDLMQKISDGKVSGTGNISGTVPVKYYPDGRIEFGKGELKTTESGIISVEPELLAGDNTQMEIARTALENFNYTILKIGVSSNEGKLTINLNMQGNNPQAFDGRAINLNVNLSGDVLPLIQQSILPINDIKQLIKEAE